ncbi:hypothetical protein [Chryseobacterium mucoviscidosis]|uniref:hypothetical protein n=1 Tax=Chryseobacterium mucoviscidosis TaxID=1945581 RepID=UPI0031D7A08F
MYSDLYKASDFLIESVENYLDLFASKVDFTAEDALNAMICHYKEVKMVDFYLNLYPKETFLLSSDSLYISLFGDYKSNLHFSFMRSFKFNDDTDETIEIQFEMLFDTIRCDSKYGNYVSLNERDLIYNENEHESLIENFRNDPFYITIRNKKPSTFELRINYNV